LLTGAARTGNLGRPPAQAARGRSRDLMVWDEFESDGPGPPATGVGTGRSKRIRGGSR